MGYFPLYCADCKKPIGGMGNGPAYASLDRGVWLCETHEMKARKLQIREGENYSRALDGKSHQRKGKYIIID